MKNWISAFGFRLPYNIIQYDYIVKYNVAYEWIWCGNCMDLSSDCLSPCALVQLSFMWWTETWEENKRKTDNGMSTNHPFAIQHTKQDVTSSPQTVNFKQDNSIYRYTYCVEGIQNLWNFDEWVTQPEFMTYFFVILTCMRNRFSRPCMYNKTKNSSQQNVITILLQLRLDFSLLLDFY